MLKKRILLKLGSNTLTKDTDHISRGKIEDIGRQIAALKDQYEFIIVSSGAIAAAKQFVKIEHNGEDINVKQALASIGQPHLMRIFQENFRELGLFTSQCLLSYSDFEKERTRINIKNTINVLVANNFIPIINENDTVATDEIKFVLIIATNTDGIYTKSSLTTSSPKTIEAVSDLTELVKEIGESKSTHGTGGMQSKIDAATIAQKAGIETWITNGLNDNFITEAIENKSTFTKIKAS